MTIIVNVVVVRRGLPPARSDIRLDNPVSSKMAITDFIGKLFFPGETKVLTFGSSAVAVTGKTGPPNTLVKKALDLDTSDLVVLFCARKTHPRKNDDGSDVPVSTLSKDDMSTRTKSIYDLLTLNFREMRGLDPLFHDPTRPKDPRSAYLRFVVHPGKQPEKLAEWRAMTQVGEDGKRIATCRQLAQLEEEARVDRERYNTEMEAWKKLNPDAPAVPARSPALFYRANCPSPGKWSELSDEERKTWTGTFNNQWSQYLTVDLPAWNKWADSKYLPRVQTVDPRALASKRAPSRVRKAKRKSPSDE